MTEPALRLLVSLLQARPARRSDLPALGLDDGPLDGLIRAGFVAQTGDRLSYDEPAAVLARQARATAGLIAVLPALTREWQNHPRITVGVEVVHGHEEQWRAWARHAALTPPRAPINLYPSLGVLRDVIAPSLAEVVGPYPEGMRHARAVLPAAAVVTDDDRAVIDVLIRAGLRVRLARRVASWLYSDPEVLCALPLTWGDDPPPSIMIVHDPAIRALTAAYCETVWQAAAPYRAPKPEFHGVLRLLALGMSDRAIATAQCTSQRTVERRIAEAMAHYGVGTRFELGMAWSAEQVDEG